MTLDELNSCSAQAAATWFEQTCAAQNWIKQMVASRPFQSLQQLEQQARQIWTTMQEPDLLEAFSAHPMIGDVSSLRKKFASTKAMASNEQSGASDANEAVLQELSQLNHDYLAKNGFIFIICATGLSAETMLNELKQRIHNNRATELQNAAAHQINITILRFQKGLQNT